MKLQLKVLDTTVSYITMFGYISLVWYGVMNIINPCLLYPFCQSLVLALMCVPMPHQHVPSKQAWRRQSKSQICIWTSHSLM